MLLLASLSCALLSAQQRAQPDFRALDRRADVREVTLSPERGTPALIRLTPEAAARPAGEVIADLFQLKGGATATLAKTTNDRSGLRVEQYQEYYRGVKVEHGRYNAVYAGDDLQLVSSEHYAIDQLDVTPTLDRDAALQRALESVGATQYAWEYIEDTYQRFAWSPAFLAHVDRELAEVQPGGELVIVDDYATEANDPGLAWKFNVYAADPLSRAWVYVNAHTGAIMLSNPIIKHASDPIQVQTRYAGKRTIYVDRQTNGTDPYNGLPLIDSRTNLPATGALYVLRDDTRGGGLETYDLNGVGGLPLSLPAIYAQGKAFTDDDLDWSLAEHKRGGFNEAENDDIAWDAHWGTQMVYDYWLNVHGRRSYDDNDVAIKSFLHYGVAYDNAFWNGTAMTYGDGSYQGGLNPDGTFAPLMSLDVCGHEIGHAVCSHTSDLVYAKESGAMNEGFSDIWGAAIEAYAARAVDPHFGEITDPFAIGEQIDERDGGVQYPATGWGALRYMDEPNRAGNPDTYGGAFWTSQEGCTPGLTNDQCGVHNNSGVLNKWFYLLTAGEDGTNDKGDDYSVAGVGFEVSERIAYGTLLLLTPNATFAEARAASIAFVKSMSEAGGGACGAYEAAVTNAWYGVGVGDAFNCEQVASFVTDATYVSEFVADANGCTASKIVEVEAGVTGSGYLRLGGTATQNVDYAVVDKIYRAGRGGFSVHTFQIEIFDDGFIEGEETIVLSLGEGTPHVITIFDDEVPLTVGNSTKTLLDQSMHSASLPGGWFTHSFIDNGFNTWYTSVLHGAVVSPAALGGLLPTPVYFGSDQIGDDVILASPKLDARGVHSLHLTFDWKAGGEVDATPDAVLGTPTPFDYGNLTYSFDGENWVDFPYDPFVGLGGVIAQGSFDEVLPAFLEGTTFHLGWRWRNDVLISTAYSFSFENVKLTAKNPGIATQVVSAERRMRGNESVFFLTPDRKQVIGGFESRSQSIFGCTTMEILTAGTGKNRCSGGIFMDKTYKVSASNWLKNRQISVRFFLTDEEIESFEAATGKSRQQLAVYSSDSYGCSTGAKLEKAKLTYLKALDGGIMVTAELTSNGNYFSLGVPDTNLPFLRTAGNEDATAETFGTYPNPFGSELTVTAPVTDQRGTIRVYGLTGSLLREQPVAGPRTTLNLADLPAGAYVVRVQLSDGNHLEQRVVKR